MVNAATKPAFRPVKFGPMEVDVIVEEDGSQRVRPCAPLPQPPSSLCEALRERAARHPDRVFLAQRGTGGNWERATYGKIKQRSDAIAQNLIDRGLGPD